jgi:hypothetical protein
MPNSPSSKNGFSKAANPLQTISPKTAAAILLMALMAVLWGRVLIRGRGGPAAAQAAELLNQAAALTPTAAPLRITPVALPVVEGRHDTLSRDFFAPDNWSGFGRTGRAVESVSATDQERQEKLHKAFFDGLAGTLNLDAIIQESAAAPARVCIEGKVLMRGQALNVKNGTETYELTVSEIGEHQVVLTWNHWSVVLKMAQPERVD